MVVQSLVIVIALANLGPGPGGVRPTAAPLPRDTGTAVVDCASSSSFIPASSPRTGFSLLSLWRHRIKSVLPDKVAWCPQPVDRGPAELPDLIEPWTGGTRSAVRLKSLIALRC
jgi:hypothetical protein